MLLAYFLDFLVTEHAARLGCIILMCVSLNRRRIFSIFLLDFESGSSCPILGKVVRTSLTIIQAASWSLVRLCLLILVSICQSHLPLFGVLTPRKAANPLCRSDLVIDFIDILIAFERFNGSDEGNFSHHNDFLEQKVDQTFFQILVVVSLILFNKSNRFYHVY